ncbi:hypothetical protein ADL32_24700 [Streptomyces albidoflavus]|nr:hypothetical protein ADL32_24700 [Streptomyces albidoflavus]
MFGLDDNALGSDAPRAIVKDAFHGQVTPSVRGSRLHQPFDVLVFRDGPQQIEDEAFKPVIIQAIPWQCQGC